ncbi:MAG: response regulator, partial [Brevundimonas sp.]
AVAAMMIASRQQAADPGLQVAVVLFILGISAAAWRQWRSDREAVELMITVTERSRQLRSALAEAEANHATAERANKAKSRFLAMISHEVRTPLNVILGLTEVLRGRRRPKAEAAVIDDMADAGGMLLRLLNGALDISRIESGHIDVRLAPVDVGERLRAIARVWRSRVDELGLTLEVELQCAPESFIVLTDEARVEQVLINYLSNALKLTPAGTIRILARALPAADGRVELEFEVHDQGPGVPEDQRERIFQPFEQLADGRAAGGSGLGLALCRASAGALGGAVGVRAGHSGGAVFWFRFTADRASLPADPPPPGTVEGRGRILAAEDHPANRKLLALVFQSFDMELVLVENGQQAVEAVRDDRFDLVLMDAMMPVMDGVEAVMAIRAEEAASGRPRLPIHMLTANVFDDDVARYRAAGADGVLRKPMEIAALQAVLASIPREQHPRRLLIAGLVPRHGGHEAVGRLPGLARPVRPLGRLQRALDQLAQGDRRAAGLGGQPVPVARQQGHLARDDAQLRTPRPPLLRLRRGRQPGEGVGGLAAQVQVDCPAVGGVEDQHRLPRPGRQMDRGKDVARGTTRDEPVSGEGENGAVCGDGHGCSRLCVRRRGQRTAHANYYPDKTLWSIHPDITRRGASPQPPNMPRDGRNHRRAFALFRHASPAPSSREKTHD